jgi:hypothetical protein
MQAKMMRAKLKKQFAAVFAVGSLFRILNFSAVEKFFFLPVRGQSAH